MGDSTAAISRSHTITISLSVSKHIYQNLARHHPQLNKQNEDQCLSSGVFCLCQQENVKLTPFIHSTDNPATLLSISAVQGKDFLIWCLASCSLSFSLCLCQGQTTSSESPLAVMLLSLQPLRKGLPYLVGLAAGFADGTVKLQTSPC